MYNYDGLMIEVTRMCNKSCDFCMRGEAQNLSISREIIDSFFDDICDVKKIFLTGGEPLLELSTIEYIVESIIKHNFNLLNFQIVSNGTILDKRALDILDKLYQNSKTSVNLLISNHPMFYDVEQSKRAVDFYSQLVKSNEYNIQVIYKGYDQVFVNTGNAKDYIEKHRHEFNPYGSIIAKNTEINHRIKIVDNTVCCMVMLTSNGFVVLNGDNSYEDEENKSIGNILDLSLTEIINKHNDSCVRLCDECSMYTAVYDNLDFLPASLQNGQIILYEFQRLNTMEVWHKRELTKSKLPLLPVQDIIDALPVLDLSNLTIDDFKRFNTYTENDYRKVIRNNILEIFFEEKELHPGEAVNYALVLNAIVDLGNTERKSKPGQKDIFLNDTDFLKSDTFEWLKLRNNKYKFGLLNYDNRKVFICDE